MNIDVLTVTGGAGFLGRAVLSELVNRESEIKAKEIRVLDWLEEEPVQDPSITYLKGDIRDPNDVDRALEGAQAVLHLAALVDWGTHSKQEVFDINLGGTEEVVKGCKRHGVKALVATSSLDAIYTGKAILNGNEDLPYPKRFPNAYCQSKAEAEQRVLEADSAELKTVVLRPGGIYGEADPYHITALVNLSIKGPYMRMGNPERKCMHVYVGNVAHGHIMACKALLEGKQALRGKPYFLLDSPPANFFTFLDDIVKKAGYSINPEGFYLPGGLMYVLGSINEGIAFLLRPFYRYTPKLSRFAVTYTCNDFILNGERAKTDFGYRPKYSTEEAVERTAAYFREKGPVAR